MNKIIRQAFKYFYDEKFRLNVNSILGFNHYLSDEEFLKRAFKIYLGYDLNLENPQTFNEKLQWLKLHDRKPEYTKMADKYEAKKWAASIIGEEYIIPTFGVYDNFDEINFDELPEQFVLKCNHDCGSIIIVRDKNKFDKAHAKKFLNKRLKRNYFWQGREWPYKNIKPRIIAEKYMKNPGADELIDYKFMCFNGQVKCSFVCSDRFSSSGLKVTFYDKNWNMMPFERHYPKSKTPIEKPKCYDEMLKIAEKLSVHIPFIRIDIYEINGSIYLGELTFFPGGGMEEFTPIEWDYKLGDWLKLPDLV